MNPTQSVITGTGKPRLIREMTSAIFTSSANTTYTATSVTDTSGLSSVIALGMRVRAKVITTVSSVNYEVLAYAKITSVDLTNKVLTVDEWIGGTPTNAQAFTVDGWIADLPRALEDGLVETFDPQPLVHRLWLGHKATKDRGYDYSARISWSKRATPDMFFELRNIMTQQITGSDETLILIPRVDKPGISYRVYIDTEFSIKLAPNKKYYTGFELEFTGKDRIATPPHFLWNGYGTAYGTLYGTRL